MAAPQRAYSCAAHIAPFCRRITTFDDPESAIYSAARRASMLFTLPDLRRQISAFNPTSVELPIRTSSFKNKRERSRRRQSTRMRPEAEVAPYLLPSI
jgi:hypothetical protein